jgi:hypothetical protein
MNARAVMCWFAALLFILPGCRSTASRPSRETAGPGADTIEIAVHQGYALLYATLKDEARLDKSLILKNPGSGVSDLIRSIARFADEASTRLETMSREEPGLDLSSDGLPGLELAARDSISSSTAKQILLSGGDEFGFNILMTQSEALKYLNALAGSLAKREPDDGRRRFLKRVADDAAMLHALVIDRLKTPYINAAQR